MKALIPLSLLCVILSASHVWEKQQDVDIIIEAVNNANTTWTAGRVSNSDVYRHYATGSLSFNRRRRSTTPFKTAEHYKHIPDENIPKEFDARKKWPQCRGIRTVRDQGNCGSCWAVAATAAFSDRLCIASGGKFNMQLSSQELISCCKSYCFGCFGGFDYVSWLYFKDHGVVTGGDYGSKKGCRPYEIQQCQHYLTGHRPNCTSFEYSKTPECKQQCIKSYKKPFETDRHKVSSTFTLKGVKTIQKDIMTNGPVQASFIVYEDFVTYRSGVYQHVTGRSQEAHSVKIIGWGVEENTPYWLAANSWNSDWGHKGFFKIKRGTNECKIESGVNSGTPIV